jgi:hypothetical protein
MDAFFDFFQMSLVIVSAGGILWNAVKIILSAFRIHFIWGALILLAPVILPVFVVRHWVTVGGWVMNGILFMVLFLFAWQGLPYIHTFVSETVSYSRKY